MYVFNKFFLFLLIFSISLHVSSSDFVVEENLARYAADITAYNNHLTKDLYEQSVYYNLQIKPAAYVYVYELPQKNTERSTNSKIENKNLPSAEIFYQIKDQIKSLRSNKDKQKEIRELRSQLMSMEKSLRQRDKFVTIVISATLDKGPVLDRYFGLPHHEYKKQLLQYEVEKNNKSLSGNEKVIMLDKHKLYFVSDPSLNSHKKNAINPDSIELISINNGAIEEKVIEPVQNAINKRSSSNNKIPRLWQLYMERY